MYLHLYLTACIKIPLYLYTKCGYTTQPKFNVYYAVLLYTALLQ